MEVRTDLISTVLKPGVFTQIERGLTFHIRERRADGNLVGVMVDDLRNPKERITILAERGQLLDVDKGKFLVLSSGSIHRREDNKRDPSIITFDRYAFDLSRFSSSEMTYRGLTARERYLWELRSPMPGPPGIEDVLYLAQPGAFHAEFHDRLVAPLYPLVFAVLSYAFLGMPATTRQSRAFAIGCTIMTVGVLRFVGFGSTIVAARNPIVIVLLYGSIALAFAGGFFILWRGVPVEPPRVLSDVVDALRSRIARFQWS